jgi:hypothetical protein
VSYEGVCMLGAEALAAIGFSVAACHGSVREGDARPHHR